MIKAHWNGITAYFDTKVTNGILEGINAKIQLAKRRAREYRNTLNFIHMIYFHSAKLKFDYLPKAL
jgi:transposase